MHPCIHAQVKLGLQMEAVQYARQYLSLWASQHMQVCAKFGFLQITEEERDVKSLQIYPTVPEAHHLGPLKNKKVQVHSMQLQTHVQSGWSLVGMALHTCRAPCLHVTSAV